VPDIEQKTVFFIVGNRKNAGKTTVLNNIVSELYDKGEVNTTSLLTIGWDGENKDRIFENKKPPVTLYPGILFVTASCALKKISFNYEVIHSFDFSSTAGKYYICRSLDIGNIELIGPENNNHIEKMISKIKSLGVKKILIDGALDRLTQISTNKHGKILFVFSPLPSWSEDKILREFKKSILKFSIPRLDREIPVFDKSAFLDDSLKIISEIVSSKKEPDDYSYIFINGALTEKIFKQYKNNTIFIIKDIGKCFVSKEKDLKRIFTINRPTLSHIYYNPNNNLTWSRSLEKKLKNITKELFSNVKISDILDFSKYSQDS